MKLGWTLKAQNDRQRIYLHISSDNAQAASKLDAAFDTLAESLLRFPNKGREGRQIGTRELVVHPNYILLYRTRDQTIEILRILHAAQRWP